MIMYDMFGMIYGVLLMVLNEVYVYLKVLWNKSF